MVSLPLAGGVRGGHSPPMATFRPRPTRRAQSLRNGSTKAERHLWSILRGRQLGGAKFSRQMPVGPYICDFLCREHGLVVEVDGGQHADSSYDRVRDRFLASEGLRVLRFWNNDVLANLDSVASQILQALPTPSPSRKREGDGGAPDTPPPACGRGPGGGPTSPPSASTKGAD